MLNKITLIYFSPTGNTRRAALMLASAIAGNVDELDLSRPEAMTRNFTENETVMFAGPVYGGRIPDFMLRRLDSLQGANTRAVTAAIYGNRAFDDALLELNNYVTERGFAVAASAALVAEHSIVRSVAAGRPDDADREQIRGFAEKVLQKLASGGSVAVPGNMPYVAWTPTPVTPVATDECAGCGLCAEQCPTRAIPADDPRRTDPDKCILCMRCVSICPNGARGLPAPAQEMMRQKLSPLEAVRRENELFI